MMTMKNGEKNSKLKKLKVEDYVMHLVSLQRHSLEGFSYVNYITDKKFFISKSMLTSLSRNRTVFYGAGLVYFCQFTGFRPVYDRDLVLMFVYDEQSEIKVLVHYKKKNIAVQKLCSVIKELFNFKDEDFIRIDFQKSIHEYTNSLSYDVSVEFDPTKSLNIVEYYERERNCFRPKRKNRSSGTPTNLE